MSVQQRVPQEIVRRLRCPTCSRAMRSDGSAVVCDRGHRLPWRDGYLDASPSPADPLTERTFQSFGYEWNRFAEVHPRDAAFWEEYFVDVPMADLKGRIALDAGCGQGRFSRFTARQVDALVALDGSSAVHAAVRNLADLSNVTVVKADLRRAPFEDESFGFISCLGVLHHLTDPQEGFRALTRLLAPDGIILLYLYSRPEARGLRSAGLSVAAAMRRFTVHLPHPILRALSALIGSALYVTCILPGRLGDRMQNKTLAALPLSAYRGRPWAILWLDTFDRLSAPLENRYLWSDLKPWFEDAGLEVKAAVSRSIGLTVVARRPSSAEPPPST